MLKKLVIAMMLLAAPFAQAKMVLACAMMDGGASTSCCCDHPRPGPNACDEPAPTDRCCAVGIEKNKDTGIGAVVESVVKKPIKKLWDNSPDVATAPPVLPATVGFLPTSEVSPLPEPHLPDGSSLYLLTARLRL